MLDILLTTERAAKNIVDRLSSSLPCYTGTDNDIDETADCVTVEAENAAEVFPNTGVYRVSLTVETLEAAPNRDETLITSSHAIFNAFRTLTPASMSNAVSGSNYFVYGFDTPTYSKTQLGDSWVQTMNVQINCCLTA